MKNNSYKHLDNRDYDYSALAEEKRPDYNRIIEVIPEGSKIVDLGCGNGKLMERLIAEKKVTASGMELSNSAVDICRQKNLDVIHGRIDQQLPYNDNQFEYAVCHITIQMVMFPEILLQEMKRISTYQVISFPNFAFYRNRLDLLLHGRMPKPLMFDYKWYSTGHIHQLSCRDFRELVYDVQGLDILKYTTEKSGNGIKDFLVNKFPNLFELLIVYILKKNEYYTKNSSI